MERSLPGVYNVAGDGVLVLSEVAGLLGRSYAPVLPPWGTGAAAAVARRLGLNFPPEVLGQLRYGRGTDNRKLKATGFRYRYTSRESVIKLGEHMRLHPILREVQEPYHYEREVEEFLRWSPNVRDSARRGDRQLSPRQLVELEQALEQGLDAGGATAGTAEASSTRLGIGRYDDLTASEIVPMLGALEPEQLTALQGARAADGRTPHRAVGHRQGAVEGHRLELGAPAIGAQGRLHPPRPPWRSRRRSLH